MKYYFSSNGITAYLMRDVRKKQIDDVCPLRWCITYKRKRAYYSTGKSLNLRDWDRFEKADEADFNFKTKTLDLKEIKTSISNYFNGTLKPILSKLENNFSFEALNQSLGKSDILSLNDAYNDKIRTLKENNRIGNSVIYQTSLNSLEDFRGENIPFSSVDVSFLKKYEKHLLDKGIKTASISIYMRTLRAIINNEGKPYLKDEAYPFGRGKYVPSTSKGVKIALTLKQIRAIENYDCKDRYTELCRDMWLFSFYGSGINYTDIFRAKYSDIVIGELTFVRYKTRNTRNDETYLSVPILDPMKRIILKYGNKSKDGYIFPIINECKTETEIRKKISNLIRESNKRIKAICKELKNDDDTPMIPNFDLVNNYTARHSYATILNKLRVPESFISQQLGHSTQSVTQGYFGGYDRDYRFEYNSLLLNPENENRIKILSVI